MKILITGGHVTCAAAVIDKFVSRGVVDLTYVGRKYIRSSRSNVSFEYELIKKRNINFNNLDAPRLNRTFSLDNLVEILKIPIASLESYKIIRHERPEAVLCFGGGIGFFISLFSWFFKIPVFVHEQTLAPGLTNRLIGKIAKNIFISFPQASKFFKSDKVIITGNPLRQQIFQIIKKPFDIKKDKKVIYVTGGSQGAHAINLLIEASLEKFLDKFILIHQTGDSAFSDFERLSLLNRPNYFVKKKFLDEEIGYVLKKADLVISRAGANTIFELMALKKPAILIPLPWASYKEQEIHAQFMSGFGVANIFKQEEGDEGKFMTLVDRTIKNLDTMIRNYDSLKEYSKNNAADKIVEKILAQT